MENLSRKISKETKIYYLVNNNGAYHIETDNEYNFIMESAEETTSPRGIEMKLHIEEIEYFCDCDKESGAFNKECRECEGTGIYLTYDVYDWGCRGQDNHFVKSFETEEEAEDYIFNKTCEYDFIPDDQRDTMYFNTIDEAEIELISRMAGDLNIDNKVAKSIYYHQLKLEELKKQQENKLLAQYKINAEIQKNEIKEKLLTPPDNSTFEDAWNNLELKQKSGLSWRDYKENLKKQYPEQWGVLKLKFQSK